MELNGLLGQLQRKHETRKIVPWGLVLIIPSRSWKPEWTRKLQGEGCKIFKQFHNGSEEYLVKHSVKAVPSKPKEVVPKPKAKSKQSQQERQPSKPKQQSQRRAYNHWSRQEEKGLEQLYAEGKLHVKEIAEKLNRTVKSVEQRAFKLGVGTPLVSMPWSSNEETILKRLIEEGTLHIREIAAKLNRTRKAVEQKIYKLNKPQKQNEYVLTERMKKRLEASGKRIVCYHCEKTLKIGDKLVTRRANKTSSHKMYHQQCWESMFIEV